MTRARHHADSGFTLLETMFVVATMTILSGIVMTTFLFLNRAATSMTAYRSTHARARHALMVISADIRAARSASVSTQDSLLLTRQGTSSSRPIRYNREGNVLRRRDGTVNHILCQGVSGMQIDLLTREGKPASEVDKAVMVRTTLALVENRRGGVATNTSSVVTVMRNADSP